MSEPRYPILVLETAEEHGDVLSGALFELGATGVEERDQTTFHKGPLTGQVMLVASFDDHETAKNALDLLLETDIAFEGHLDELVGDAWRDEWKKYYEPFQLTPSITIRPPWEELPASGPHTLPGHQVLTLEPGRAFGTGLHATTSLVAGLLEEHRAALAGVTVLDAGCGSGILSFVALLLGAAKADMFDIDAEVLPTVSENAELNQLQARCHAFAGTISDVTKTYPWVLANIEARILEPIADELVARVDPGGHLILSGILTQEEERMREVFGAAGRKLRFVAARHMSSGGERAYDKDGWVALHFERVIGE